MLAVTAIWREWRQRRQTVRNRWTRYDQRKAMEQGWLLSEHPDGLQLQHYVEDPQQRFDGDEEAWLHVLRESLAGDPLARKALLVISQENPMEMADILKFAASNSAAIWA